MANPGPVPFFIALSSHRDPIRAGATSRRRIDRSLFVLFHQTAASRAFWLDDSFRGKVSNSLLGAIH
jgi:hypothetical protein